MASKRAKAALASGLGIVAMTATYLTVPWEGLKTHAYWDSLGKVWTGCAGETKGVQKGDTYSKQQCMNMLYARMEKDYHQPLMKSIAGFDGMPKSVQGTLLDLSRNIGVAGVCNSSAARYARNKQWAQACEAVTLYNNAGGQVVRGLDVRRKDRDADMSPLPSLTSLGEQVRVQKKYDPTQRRVTCEKPFPYLGPGIWIRIQHRFGPRMTREEVRIQREVMQARK